MAVKIRLRRVGAKKQPAYRIVAADSRAPRDGRFIEILGAYNPLTNPSTVKVNSDRVLYWLRTGALPSDIVKKILIYEGVWALFTGEAMPEAPVVEEVAPVAETAPVEEAAPAEEVAASEEAAPVEEVAATEEVAPTEEAPATEASAE